MMQSLRSAIHYDIVPTLVEQARKFQLEQEARLKTGKDLEKICKFMISPDAMEDGYNRICDLQGFFMKTSISRDPEGVELYSALANTCCDDTYPTTQKVINSLEGMKTASHKVEEEFLCPSSPFLTSYFSKRHYCVQ